MRDDDRVRIQHMVDAAEAVAEFLDGRSLDDLHRDRMLLFAVVRAIEVLGEAASRISAETRAQGTAVPWSAITGMRNRLIHGYFDVDAAVVWQTATVEVPALLASLRALLTDERQQ